MKTARFFVFLALLGMMLNPGLTLAGQLQSVKVELSDPRPSQSAGHNFHYTFTTGGNTIRAFKMSYCEQSSGGCTTPDALDTSSATFTSGSAAGLTTAANWTINTTSAASGILLLQDSTGNGEDITANTYMYLPFAAVTNSEIAADCDGDSETSSDTCFVQISVCTDAACSNAVDTGIGTYTVVNAVTVTARIDPTFTFTLEGTNAATTFSGGETDVVTTANTIPFGNMQANEEKYAAQKLTVVTNTQSGYTVGVKALTAGGGVMSGVYSGNHVDSFPNAWTNPDAWTQPSGTSPNVNTAWLGMNTSDTDVANWGTPTNKYGGVTTSNRTVMQSSSSDDGSSPVYVTYVLEANVFHPADTYTGTIMYTATPTY